MTAANPEFAAASVFRRVSKGAGLRLFPTDIDLNACVVELVEVDGAELRAATFLDERWQPAGKRVRVSLPALDGARLRLPHLLFHTAFCGSTLLARALDVPGRSLVLREPGILVRLSNLKRERHPLTLDAARWREVVRGVLGLIAGAADDDERVAVKLSNTCSNLIDDALLALAEQRAVLLYSDLRSFLVSVLKKGEQGRGFVRRQCLSFSLDVAEARAVPARELLQMTDLQMAAAVWLMQMQLFERQTKRRDARVCTLDSAAFLHGPKPALAAADAFLGLGLGREVIETVAEGPVFRQHSKLRGQPFDLSTRQEDAREVEAVFGDDIDRTVAAAMRSSRKKA